MGEVVSETEGIKVRVFASNLVSVWEDYRLYSLSNQTSSCSKTGEETTNIVWLQPDLNIKRR